MVTITFPDRDTEKRALAYLIGRFSGGVLRTGEHLVPTAAVKALAEQNILFTVQGSGAGRGGCATMRTDTPNAGRGNR
jgi:hypothetical protein